MIWKRTLACQMKEARLKALGVDIVPFSLKKITDYVFAPQAKQLNSRVL